MQKCFGSSNLPLPTNCANSRSANECWLERLIELCTHKRLAVILKTKRALRKDSHHITKRLEVRCHAQLKRITAKDKQENVRKIYGTDFERMRECSNHSRTSQTQMKAGKYPSDIIGERSHHNKLCLVVNSTKRVRTYAGG